MGHFERLPVPDVDALGVPESWLLFTDTLLVFDHVQHIIKVVSHVRLDGDIEAAYQQATWRVDQLVERLAATAGGAAVPSRSTTRTGPSGSR